MYLYFDYRYTGINDITLFSQGSTETKLIENRLFKCIVVLMRIGGKIGVYTYNWSTCTLGLLPQNQTNVN